MEELNLNMTEPAVLPILRIRQETDRAKTLFFSSVAGQAVRPPASPELNLSVFLPGQMVMVWLPRLDEKPYTVSYLDEEEFGVTVVMRGEFSARLHELGPGDPVGFRGPYGRPFSPPQHPARAVAVGGGCGMATLALLAEDFPSLHIIQGARNASELFFTRRFPVMELCTEDGSCGHRGVPTEVLETALAEGRYDQVYACGPELMLSSLFEVCRRHATACQFSLERYMKCGIGVCGQCDCDGMLVCRDGPVFDGEQLSRMPSFGRFARMSTGRRVSIEDYAFCKMEGDSLFEVEDDEK
jgi:dihydroorotate dehydrogenase electron transfer subunit